MSPAATHVPSFVTELTTVSNLLELLGALFAREITEDCVVPFGAADYLAAQCDAASSTLRHLASEMHHHAQQADA